MADRDDFNNDDPRWDRPRAPKTSSWEEPGLEDETTDFARRQEGAKRETAKRQRAAQKFAREYDAEPQAQSQNRDRRALEKEIKRRYAELKRIADELGIKQILQDLSASAGITCWGPDVASDKKRPSLGVFLNYTDTPLESAPAELTHGLFGAWLYMANTAESQIQIAIGSKVMADDAEQTERARAPEKDARSLTIPYRSNNHEGIRNQIQEALLSWQHAN